MTEFWNSDITGASWKGLQELKEDIDFTLIGGWAIYLYTKLQKSKDIDIIVDYSTLRVLESKYSLNKNERLRKYEIKFDRYDIDIYLPNYSRLAIPPKHIASKFTEKVEGFSVPTPEALMALKLGAAIDRRKSTKGIKDTIDILGLLFYSGLNLSVLNEILSEYKLVQFMDLLVQILKDLDKRDLAYLNLNEKSFSDLKHKYIDEIRNVL